MTELIIGGTSGLGLEIARQSAQAGNEVIVTGRHDPRVDFAQYKEFDLGQPELSRRIGSFVGALPEIKSLVYAVGYYQEGRVTELDDAGIETMLDVGGRGLIYFTRELLDKQGELDELVTISSTSQWTPRELEPIYNYVKAGAAHYSNALSLDPRVGKVLVAGPSGMATEFWAEDGRDTSHMMRPEWVAEQVTNLRRGTYSYQFAKILGAAGELPQRVEIVDTRA